MEWLTQATTLCGERSGRYRREVEASRSNPLGNDLPSAAQLSTHQHQQRGGGEEGGALSKLANNQFLVQLCTRGGKSRTQFDVEEWELHSTLPHQSAHQAAQAQYSTAGLRSKVRYCHNNIRIRYKFLNLLHH